MLKVACALSLSSAVHAGSTVVAFTGKGSEGWQQYDWDSITHLAFWSMPDDTVKSKAKESGVKLFQSNKAHLGPNDWTSSSAVDDAVASIKAQVSDSGLDGVFFDYEGNQLSDKEKTAYTSYVKQVADAIAPAQVFVCVGGRPTYEWRNYDYAGLAEASAFLFIMGYDMHFYDDYTCVVKGTCSPAEAPLADLKAGVKDYASLVAADKLVLGLPWYGQRYTQTLNVLTNRSLVVSFCGDRGFRFFVGSLLAQIERNSSLMVVRLVRSCRCKNTTSGRARIPVILFAVSR